MARPPLPVGTYGEIACTQVAPSKYKARARYRDRDGATRTVARFGQTKREARDRLRAALGQRKADTGSHAINRDTTVQQLATAWLAEIDGSSRAVTTKRLYRHGAEHWIVPALGSLRLGEIATSTCNDALATITTEHGPSAAKTARAVLSGMFRLAAQHDALTLNPIRETSPITVPRRVARALTGPEVDTLTDRLRSTPRALLLDLPDLIDMGLATGCRIGELLALRDSVIDLDAGTVEINATAIRVKGRGLVIQERPKTAAGWRVLALPSYAVEMLRARREQLRLQPASVTILDTAGGYRDESMWVAFASPQARTIRDPSNAAGDLRDVLKLLVKDAAARAAEDSEPGTDPLDLADSVVEATAAADFRWVTFHTFRKTVATRLDEAGLTPREIADQLGHAKPSMTQDVYMGRKVVSARAAAALDR